MRKSISTLCIIASLLAITADVSGVYSFTWQQCLAPVGLWVFMEVFGMLMVIAAGLINKKFK